MSSPFDGYFEVNFSTASYLRRRNRQRQEQQRRRIEAERRRQEQERRRLQEEERRRKREQREAQERERRVREARERERQAREEARRVREAEDRRKKQEAEELARKIRELERNAGETRQLREIRQQQEEQIMQQKAAETRRLREAQKQQLNYEEKEKKVKLLRNSLYRVYELNLSDNLRDEAENLEHELEAHHTAEALEDFSTSCLAPFLIKCRNYHERFENYLSLMDKYKVSAEMVGIKPQEVPFDENFEAVLTGLIGTLEELVYTNSKREYIHQAMNEEMASMGYKVVGFREMSIPSGGSFREELYQIDDDGVAASVIYQDNGQISIEIGALRSTGAREEYPLDDKMPVVLENHQRSFCVKALKFEADMSAKGITCSVTRQPPSGTHAPDFMIEDYKMQHDVKILASERGNNFSDSNSTRRVNNNG